MSLMWVLLKAFYVPKLSTSKAKTNIFSAAHANTCAQLEIPDTDPSTETSEASMC